MRSKCVPNAKVIHIVRDGRDVALSIMEARFGPKTVYSAAQRWIMYLKAIEKINHSLPKHKYYEISYEQLLQNPEKTLRGACSFLGEIYPSNMLEFYKDGSKYGSYTHEHANLQSSLIRNNANKWHKKMSHSDVDIFQVVAWKYLTEYGYKVETSKRKVGYFEVLQQRLLKNPTRKALALLLNRPGLQEEFVLMNLRLRLILRYSLRKMMGKAG